MQLRGIVCKKNRSFFAADLSGIYIPELLMRFSSAPYWLIIMNRFFFINRILLSVCFHNKSVLKYQYVYLARKDWIVLTEVLALYHLDS